MTNAWFACRPCNPSDPTQDTVKVDVGRLDGADKENVMPSPQISDKDKEAQKKHAEEQRRVQEEQLRIEKEAEERRKREQEEAAAKAAKEESLRLQELERIMAEERLLQEAEAERIRQEEERLQQEAEEERLRQEAAEIEANKKQMAELQSAQEKMASWCKTHGYVDPHTPKTTIRGNKKQALHTAVKHQDCEAVKMLLLCGAKKDAKDSKGQTALQLAEKIKPGRTREAILAALC